MEPKDNARLRRMVEEYGPYAVLKRIAYLEERVECDDSADTSDARRIAARLRELVDHHS